MSAETIAYQDGATALSGLVYRPAGTPRAAVAVYPTIMNQGGVVLDKAQALADAGYLAMVADFYGKQPDKLRAIARVRRRNPRHA